MRQERGGYTTTRTESHTPHEHTHNTNINNGAKPLSSSHLPGLQMEEMLRGGEEGRSDKGIIDVRGGPLTTQQKRVDQKKHAL